VSPKSRRAGEPFVERKFKSRAVELATHGGGLFETDELVADLNVDPVGIAINRHFSSVRIGLRFATNLLHLAGGGFRAPTRFEFRDPHKDPDPSAMLDCSPIDSA
jgi:hypothetical protein